MPASLAPGADCWLHPGVGPLQRAHVRPCSRPRSQIHRACAHCLGSTSNADGGYNRNLTQETWPKSVTPSKNVGADLRSFDREEHHAHLPASYPPSVAISRLVNSLRGLSSGQLGRDFAERINPAAVHGWLWSPS